MDSGALADKEARMNREELKALIGRYEMHCNTFHTSEFVVNGDAEKVRRILEELTHDELLIPEKEA
jgi:hypothetical protein